VSYAKKARDVRIRGLNGAGTVELSGEVPHGAGKRLVSVEVTPLRILELAAALVCCPGAIESPGHAVWHLDHPNDPRPCGNKFGLDESKLRLQIDVQRLHDAIALATAERARILRFLETKQKQLDASVNKEAFAAGYIEGVRAAIAAGEHEES
jgi:hypothetical protein